MLPGKKKNFISTKIWWCGGQVGMDLRNGSHGEIN